jgi:hypothetical protein
MPPRVSVELVGRARLERDMDGVERGYARAEELYEAVGTYSANAAYYAKQFAKRDTGKWANSITPVSSRPVPGVQTTFTIRLTSSVAHAPFAHDDTRRHTPPWSGPAGAHLRQWCLRKGANLYLVVRSIQRRGTKGDLAMYRGIEKVQASIQRVLVVTALNVIPQRNGL